MIIDVIKDTLLDGVKLLPFLFLAYLLIEIIEDRSEERAVALVRKAGRLGPVLGGTVGVIPQCGFSAAMSNLYSTGLITRGTLLAVFLSTSDEMLPILISEKAGASFILKVLLFKLIAGVIVGVVADIFFSRLAKGGEKHIHDMCEREGCKCEDGIMKSALFHTLKIFLFLLAVTFVLNLAVELVGEEKLGNFIMNKPVVGELLAGVIGLIPNCAASVVLTELYLQGGLSIGAMMSGLLVGSGVGMLVLFRMNRNLKDNLLTLAILYASGVIFGLIAGALNIF